MSDAEPTVLELLDALCHAIADRDVQAVWDLFDYPAASHIPSTVREEALAIARLPKTSLRAPIKLFRFHHVCVQAGRALLEPHEDEEQRTQLDLPFEPVGGSRDRW